MHQAATALEAASAAATWPVFTQRLGGMAQLCWNRMICTAPLPEVNPAGGLQPRIQPTQSTEIPKASKDVHLHRLAPLQGQQHLQQQQWGFAPLQPRRFNQVGYPNQKAPRFSSHFLGQATSASPSSGSSTLAMATLCSPVAKPSWAQVQRPACSTVKAKNQVFWIFHSESVQAKRRSEASLVQLPKWHEPDKSWGQLAPGARVPKFQQQLESPNKTLTESQL